MHNKSKVSFLAEVEIPVSPSCEEWNQDVRLFTNPLSPHRNLFRAAVRATGSEKILLIQLTISQCCSNHDYSELSNSRQFMLYIHTNLLICALPARWPTRS